jgi:hypothetical protein
MTDALRPGPKGTPLPGGTVVLRLAIPSKDQMVSEVSFELSSEDKASDLQSLTVWAEDLTPADRARALMAKNKAAYRLVLFLNTSDIRAIKTPADCPIPTLDTVWDLDSRPGAEGHAGIIGLMRPTGGNRESYKALRTRLVDAVFKIETLPEITAD